MNMLRMRVSLRLVSEAQVLRRTLRRTRSCPSSGQAKSSTSMMKHLSSKIRATGPITVAEYMREVLTNPLQGYYVKNDMLGAEGDFITSPEISQMFGELMGIWCVSEWISAGKPRTLQLVELGPGRGSLSSDILKVFKQLHSLLGGVEVSVHLVEVSPRLSELQARCLAGDQTQLCDGTMFRSGTTHTGLPIFWYRGVQDVPKGFSIFMAHEFFDALPIHKFQRTERGWREVMVDVDPEEPERLRMVLFPAPTLASTTLIHDEEHRQHVEVCPEGGVIIQMLANRIAKDGGAALISDYGHDGTKLDTFRGFKNHQLHDVLKDPGSADLTADVDFSYLRRMCAKTVTCLGPTSQRSFLKNMGIDTRLQVLLQNTTHPSCRAQLLHGYHMLMDPEKMGHRFQFFCLLPTRRLLQPEEEEKMIKGRRKCTAPLPVAGFADLLQQQ